MLNVLLHDSKKSPFGVVVRHLDGPHVLSGHTLVQNIINASGGAIQSVSSKEWLNAATTSDSSRQVPATRLLQFYEQWLGADDGHTIQRRPLGISNTSAIFDIGSRISIDSDLITKYFVYATSYGTKSS